MDFRHLFIPESPIVSLAVSDSAVTLLRLEKRATGYKRAFIHAQPLPTGVVEGGILKNSPEFAKVVKACFDAVSPKLIKKFSSVMVTIPDDVVFVSRLEFPENLEAEEIQDSIEVNAPTKFPFPLSESYFDSEYIPPLRKGKKEIIFAQVSRTAVTPYQSALEGLGLHIVALEFESLSVLRTLRYPDDKPLLVVRESGDGCSVAFVAKKQPRFFMHKKIIDNRMQTTKAAVFSRIIHDVILFVETEFGSSADTMLFIGASAFPNPKFFQALKKELAKEQKPITIVLIEKYLREDVRSGDKNSNDLLPALGLGVRTTVNREDDTVISLLPVGTEESYQSKQTVTYVKTLSDLVIAMSVILVLLFGGTYMFLKSIGAPLHERFQQASSRSIAKGSQDLEAEARHMNQLLASIAQISGSEKPVSPILEAIQQAVIAGITVNSIQVANLDAPITLSATASTRERAIAFRDSIEKSGSFTDIELPISSLRSEHNVSFQISMKYQSRE